MRHEIGNKLSFCPDCRYANKAQLELTGKGFCSNEWKCDPSNYWAEFRPRKKVV